MTTLEKYIKLFSSSKLRVDRSHGNPAPHKPILLLSVLQSYCSGSIKNNKIYITPDLVSLFRINWNLLVSTNNVCNFALPFYHLSSSRFWKLIPKQNFTDIKFSVSFSSLNSFYENAEIDADLYSLVIDKESNLTLQKFILEEYFSNTKEKFENSLVEQTKLLDNFGNEILNDNPVEYKNEVKRLIEQKNEEEIFIRGGIFKREIPKIYNYTCCISGMNINATVNVSLIDACHIIPFSESYDDTITNGLALCPNLHRAFDRGLISIDDNYQVIVSSKNIFSEGNSNYGIRQFEGKTILLPENSKYYPSLENLANHRKSHSDKLL